MAIGGQDVSLGAGELNEGAAFDAEGTLRDIVYFDDFLIGGFVTDIALTAESDPSAKFCDLADKGEWLVTHNSSVPTIAIANDEPGGVVVITTITGANEFASCQMNGEAWKVVAKKDIYYEIRMKVAANDDTRWIVGLCSTDTTGTTIGPVLDSVGGGGDMVAFLQNGDTTSDIDCLVQSSGTATQVDTTIDIADDTFVTLGIRVLSNLFVRFYVNGVLQVTTTTNIPTGALTLTMEVHSPTDLSTLEVDYIYCAQPR